MLRPILFKSFFKQFAKDESGKTVSKDYKKTSLREPMKVFEQFLSGLVINLETLFPKFGLFESKIK